MQERIKELFFQVTFNRMRKLDRNLRLFLKGKKKSKEVSTLLDQFNQIKKDFNIVTTMKFVVLILMYISIISLFSQDVPILSQIVADIVWISGFISLPLLTLFFFVLEKASNVLMVDANFVSSRIVALLTK